MKRIGVIAGVIIFIVAIVAACSPTSPTAKTDRTSAAVAAPASTCGTSTDSTGVLQFWIDFQPANSTLTFPKGACWNVDGSLTIEKTTNLTINANGSTFLQPTAPATAGPIVQMWLNTNLTIKNLNIHGALTAGFGNSNEGDYGLEFEANNGVHLSGLSVNDIQGDFVYLSPPYDVTNTSDALNKNIWITGSTFQNGGYHGLTIESVDGFVVDDDTFTNIYEDGMDLEYDDYSTPFNADGSAYWAAQDYISILNSTWNNWNGSDWFVSDQGQTPGVQQQHVTLSGNTLNGNGPLFELSGTNPALTTPASTNNYLTITNNKMGTGAYGEPYRGSNSVTAQIYDVGHLTMTGNDFPLCPGTFGSPPTTQCLSAPYSDELDLDVITYGTIENNNFSGALGVVQPQTYDTYLYKVSECGNKYGVNGAQTDATCS